MSFRAIIETKLMGSKERLFGTQLISDARRLLAIRLLNNKINLILYKKTVAQFN